MPLYIRTALKVAALSLFLGGSALADLAAGQEALKSGDYARALGEFLPLAKQGNAVAQFKLGLMYSEGKGVPQDDEEAVQWYRRAAAQRNASAEGNLGGMYTEGRGVSKDDKEAMRWFRLAAEQNDDPDASAAAQGNLGVMYKNGQGTQRDDEEAVRWFRLGADHGNPHAQFCLGSSYYDGEGVPQDYVRAYMWFNLAAASGDAKGTEWRAIVTAKMTPDQIAEAQHLAREWKPQTSHPIVQPSGMVDWHQLLSTTAATWALVLLTLGLV
ncbi:MAG TPA: tetratricopeptide repeat protein, partial [Bryobacteraceae bacterium]|nr:tetratricopeptide repeat protein [Bryobacteraceae bacterium]